jgi:hypothetical protein
LKGFLSDDASQGEGSTRSLIRGYLNTLDKAEVIELLMTSVLENDTLYNRLALRAAHSTPAAPDIEAIRSTIERAAALDGFLEYSEVAGYAAGFDDVLPTLSALETTMSLRLTMCFTNTKSSARKAWTLTSGSRRPNGRRCPRWGPGTRPRTRRSDRV